ncbi:MAG TPA: hypothetical protein VJ729_08575 [Nitrososphaeraceae archaeon]|nr:hypothetical protein [Nitrososphaeraceae archaeon]
MSSMGWNTYLPKVDPVHLNDLLLGEEQSGKHHQTLLFPRLYIMLLLRIKSGWRASEKFGGTIWIHNPK